MATSERYDTLVVNLFGGPSAGKSSLAQELAPALGKFSISTEYAAECAKEYYWSGASHSQVLVTARQYDSIRNISGHKKVIVTDSPILIGLAYPDEDGRGCGPTWRRAVYDHHCEFRNLNCFVVRNPEVGFDPVGRYQKNADAGIRKDADILGVLREFEVPFEYVMAGPGATERMVSLVFQALT